MENKSVSGRVNKVAVNGGNAGVTAEQVGVAGERQPWD